jgi:chromosomal replication initiation ATPase DnaA
MTNKGCATEVARRKGARGECGLAVDAESACRFIVVLVCAALGISAGELRAERRGRASAAFARQTAMYLAHVQLGLSLSQVGHNFGRDRTTVAHACACVEDSRDDPKFDRMLSCLEAALGRWLQSFLMPEAA